MMNVDINCENIFFTGSGAPSQYESLEWTSRSMLFCPMIPNYPAVDFLVWDCKLKILYAIQITIKLLGTHMAETLDKRESKKGQGGAKKGEARSETQSKWDELRAQWVAVLPSDSTIEMVWLSDNDNCTAERKSQEWIVLTKDLYSPFPLLKKLVKKFQH
jgi:hypothetical protein